MPPIAPVTALRAAAYRIPTDALEADGTAAWRATTLVVVTAQGGGHTGLGYTYADTSDVGLVTGILADATKGTDAMHPQAAFASMQAAVRNLGQPGLAATAISAVDMALWDLKAGLLDLPLAALLGCLQPRVAIYGSGGFISYDNGRLATQLAGWVQRDGCRWVKMKIGADPASALARVAAAREAIGEAGLFVDANGACNPRRAVHLAARMVEFGVEWFEEPVSSDDLAGLAFVRRLAPAGMEIAAGEYVFGPDGLRDMLAAGAVDVQQLDATRCGGVTGFMRGAAVCDAFHTPLSAHCAPALHRHLGCAAPRFRHLEWFHDHARIESLLFDGAPVPRDGAIAPDMGRPGFGLALKTADALPFLVAGAA